ncbi:hypothetical protein [Arenimonas sp.]|uniref:hypothetical protein n=1 Tax=Arenimonas sp. TaxID=1872635 RepID=UPI0039E52573
MRPAAENLIRWTLGIGALFNLAAALMLLFPQSFGAFAGVPVSESVFHTWLLALFVALFGATYAWMAHQPEIPRPLLGLAAIGKTGVFFVALACWIRNDIPLTTFSLAIADLAFAAAFFWWLRRDPSKHR